MEGFWKEELTYDVSPSMFERTCGGGVEGGGMERGDGLGWYWISTSVSASHLPYNLRDRRVALVGDQQKHLAVVLEDGGEVVVAEEHREGVGRQVGVEGGEAVVGELVGGAVEEGSGCVALDNLLYLPGAVGRAER